MTYLEADADIEIYLDALGILVTRSLLLRILETLRLKFSDSFRLM